MTKTRAYSYLRISTENQKIGDGIRRQMEASQKFALEKGYELVETIEDLGVSGFKSENSKDGKFGKFLKAIEQDQIPPGSVLIVESLDRLSRDTAFAAFVQFAAIITKDVKIVTLMDGQEYSSESINGNSGQLFMSIGIMLRANDESATKSKRLKAAWAKKRTEISNKKLTKMIPAWLELSENRENFNIKPHAEYIIKKIYDLCINGMGIYSITRHLNNDLIKYPPISGAPNWNDSYITKILKNPGVHGCFQPKRVVDNKSISIGEAINDYYPIVISKNQFLLAQAAMKDRRVGSSGRKGDSYTNLFSNISKCGNCGGSVLMRSKGKPPKGNRYLRCQNAVMNNGCKCPGWSYVDFENAFYTFVSEVNFSDVLSDTTTESITATLQNETILLKQKLEFLEIENEVLVKRMGVHDLSHAAQMLIVDSIENTFLKIEDLKIGINKNDIEIAKISVENIQRDQSYFLNELSNISLEISKDKLKEIRYKLQSLIRKSITGIKLYNGYSVNPWEASEEISPTLRKELADKGIISEESIEDYFSKSDYSQRVFDHAKRNFIVRFKNGTERKITPHEQSSVMYINERNLKLIAKIRDNKSL
jgi:DNA invertase Pin-like site-specific DNA recombinase